MLYFASVSAAGLGVAVLMSTLAPMNVNAAIFAISLVFAVAGICIFRFFQSGGA